MIQAAIAARKDTHIVRSHFSVSSSML